MVTKVAGEIYAIDLRRGQVAVRVAGLTPKVIRFHTDEPWEFGEPVEVVIQRPTGTELVQVEGFTID